MYNYIKAIKILKKRERSEGTPFPPQWEEFDGEILL
jgi:hypothetical protein